MSQKPPKWPLMFFRWFCREDSVEDIEGDLVEGFYKREKRKKPAKLLLFLDVLKLFRPGIIGFTVNTQNNNFISMLQHHIKTSIRSFGRHKTSFFVNYIGLIGGLLTMLFIYLWVDHEMKVDQFHEDGERICRLINNGEAATLLNTSPRFAKELKEVIPEIEMMVNSSWGPVESSLAVGESFYSVTGEFGSKDFFNLFSYPLLNGNKEQALDKPNSILLSESTALRLFGKTNVVGKSIDWRWFSFVEPVEVSGVYRDLPKTSSSQFDYVLSFQVFEKRFKSRIDRGNANGRTFIKLSKGANIAAVNQKISDYTKKAYPEYQGKPAFLINYGDYYLNNVYSEGKPSGGRIQMVKLFGAIGVLVLIIACINFMNLSTARASLRVKDIGIRKVLGARRKALIAQFLTEACLISLFAGLTAILLLFLLLPQFKHEFGHHIELSFSIQLILAFLAIIFFTGFVSGSYPAFYLSRFNPLNILKGHFKTSSQDLWIRNGLVAFQFAVSLILIVSVLVIYQQMEFIQNKSLGYNSEYIINFETRGLNREKQKAFLNEAKILPGVTYASGISHALFGAQKSGANINWTGKNPDEQIWFEWGFVNYDMLELLEIPILEGRYFSKQFGNENSKVVINKATKDLLGFKSPIGEKITVGETEYEIIGVSNDFHFQSLHEKIKPTFFLLNESWSMKLALKLKANNLPETLREVDKLYASFDPGFLFEYSFLDQDHMRMYETEKRVTTLAKFAAFLAIMISILGLFGLVSFIIERRAKEMGIRRILGATPVAVFIALTSNFIKPLLFAIIVGVITSLYFIKQWLQGFAYQIELKWWYFAMAVATMILLSLATSISQILKVIFTNPVNALRDE